MGHMPAEGGDEVDAARVFYVAATRATQRLVIGFGGGWCAIANMSKEWFQFTNNRGEV